MLMRIVSYGPVQKNLSALILILLILIAGVAKAFPAGLSLKDCQKITAQQTVQSKNSADTGAVKKKTVSSSKQLAVIENNGTRNGKKGGTLYWMPKKEICQGETVSVQVESGRFEYLAIHKRLKNGVWKLIYKGDGKSIDYESVFRPEMNNPRLTHFVFSVNGANERYSAVACRIRLLKTTEKTADSPAAGKFKKKAEIIDQITAEELAEILNAWGLKTKAGPPKKPPYVLVQATGRKMAFLLNTCTRDRKCSKIKGLSAFKIQAKPEKINQFNQQNRYAVMYQAKPERVRLESDLELSGGVSRQTIIGFVERHRSMSARAARFLGFKAAPSDLNAWNNYKKSTMSGSTASCTKASSYTKAQTAASSQDSSDQNSSDQVKVAITFLDLDKSAKGEVELSAAFAEGKTPEESILVISASDKTGKDLSRLGLLVRVDLKGPDEYLAKEFWFKDFDPVIPSMDYAVLPRARGEITALKVIQVLKASSMGMPCVLGEKHLKVTDDQTSILAVGLKGL